METQAIDSIVTSLTEGFSASALADILVKGLTIAIPLVLLWFGFRFIYKKAKGALKKGA